MLIDYVSQSHQDVDGPRVETGLFEPWRQAAELEAARVKAMQAQDLRGNGGRREGMLHWRHETDSQQQ